MDSTIAKHIDSTPGVCGGRPRIAGHRIRVQDIVVWHETLAMTPDDIVSEYPQITLADVHAALAFYWDHRDEIDRQIAEDEAFVEQMKAKAGPGLLDRLRNTDANSDSLPS